ncbi:hypothetical protein [Glutamicibacter arilaitensis]|uniref:hypothetical protein n=1 Tax=Glutamicibacter arilaitensis TaxID=256701 RepID=UPI00384BE5C0
MAKCKPCHGGGKLYGAFGDSWDCIPCHGTGENRTGPYRLDNGTWSDGVIRKHRIFSIYFSDSNPQRVTVEVEKLSEGTLLFNVYRGFDHLDEFDSFAEAIAYADRMARTNQGENK